MALGLLAALWLINRQQRRIRQLRDEARLDPLTGLPNRRQLTHCWERLPQGADLLFIDLVGFRSVNNQHGHIIGDQLLQQVAQRLAQVVDAPESLLRWGGDEFVAIVRKDKAAQRLQQFADRLNTPFELGTLAGMNTVQISARFSKASDAVRLDDALHIAAAALLQQRQQAIQTEGNSR